MTLWKTIGLTAALAAAGAAGASFAPVVYGKQERPSPAPRVAVTQLLRSGSEIGVTIRDLSDDDSKTPRGGAVIASIVEGGPADAAGMKNGDVVTEFDGERIRGARQFSRVVEETPVGRRVDAIVLRGAQKMTLGVRTREARGAGVRLLSDLRPRLQEFERNFRFEMPSVPTPPAALAPPARPVIPDLDQFFGRSSGRLGISVDELSPQLADYFGTKDGVLVRSVTDNSVAAKAGLKAGDVITSVNNEPVTSASELRRRLQRLEDGAEFTLGVVRDKKTMTIKGKLEPRAERVRGIIT